MPSTRSSPPEADTKESEDLVVKAAVEATEAMLNETSTAAATAKDNKEDEQAAIATAAASTKTDSQEQQQELEKYNTLFYSQIQSHYNTENVFAGVLLEFLKFTAATELHAQVFDLICASKQEQLKGVVTVDTWERVQKYVDSLHQKKESTDADGPAMFTVDDLSKLQTPTWILTEHGFGTPSATLTDGASTKKKTASSSKTTATASGKRKRLTPSNARLPPKQSRQYLDSEPTENDVKFGRGGGTNNHKGNILYLLHKLKLQVPYSLIATQKGKTAISQQLVNWVHDTQHGRFVAREDDDPRWFIVDDTVARRKASQTLREDKTPRDQELKRKTLLRKLADLGAAPPVVATDGDAVPEPKKTRQMSLQEQKAGQTLLELNASAAAAAAGTSNNTATV